MKSKLDLFSANEKTSPLVHLIHSYDYDENRTKRYDSIHAANSELYTYDNLGQIKTLNHGVLNTAQNTVTTVNHSESWNFDKTGNWSQYTKNGTTENRTHNAANELQGIANHDANGNMVLMSGLKGKYDAWNHLVDVRDSNDNLIAQYEYNGLNQRIKKTVSTSVTKSFFNEHWQEVESVTNNQVTSYIWGLRYIDDLVLREKEAEEKCPTCNELLSNAGNLTGGGLFLHKMKHAQQINNNNNNNNNKDLCQKKPYTGGSPNFQLNSSQSCSNCQRWEKDAYIVQCAYLYPDRGSWYRYCVNNGVFHSCRHVCPQDQQPTKPQTPQPAFPEGL